MWAIYGWHWWNGRHDGRCDNHYGYNDSAQSRYTYWSYSRGYISGQKRHKKQETAVSWKTHYKNKAKAKIAALDKAKDAEPDEEF